MPVTCRICNWTRDLPTDFHDWPKLLNGSTDIYPVTDGGKLDGEVRAFICAKCLRNANDSRVNVKALLSNIRVSRHALDRFIERQEGERITREAAQIAIIRMYQRAKPIRFREKFMVRRYVNNGGKEARYLHEAGWILVVSVERPITVMTIERNWDRKLGIDFWYLEEDELHKAD